MATYAIGDIQGCYDALQQLLDKLTFNPKQDTLWLVGDLVNRGSQSLQVLRFIKSLGTSAICVLGNHDIQLLAIAHGNNQHASRHDTLDDIMAAPDRDELINWLRFRPFFHHDVGLKCSLVHAGLPPQWDLTTTLACAAELEQVFQGADHTRFFSDHLYGKRLDSWQADSRGWKRHRFILACFTRLRYCNDQGELLMKNKLSPHMKQADNVYPWYQCPNRQSQALRIIFGHWSTLGHYSDGQVFALDTGCLWGGELTALCLETEQITSVPCQAQKNPADFK